MKGSRGAKLVCLRGTPRPFLAFSVQDGCVPPGHLLLSPPLPLVPLSTVLRVEAVGTGGGGRRRDADTQRVAPVSRVPQLGGGAKELLAPVCC